MTETMVRAEHAAGGGVRAVEPCRVHSRRLERRDDDARLMERVQKGDAVAFEQIVERYKTPLISYLTRMTHCRDQAEDYAQEAFVRLFQNCHRYREQGVLAGYLFRIATNLLRSDERRKSRWRLLLGELARHSERHEPSPRRQALHREVSDVVGEAIATLPTRLRAPLVLREMEGWSYVEIADSLGCRVGTVKSRIHRAKSRLREQLLPYWQREARDE